MQFIAVCNYHYEVFALDGWKNIWRIYYYHDGRPCLQQLLGNEPEYSAPINFLKAQVELWR
jgi:hypothetical protein